MIFLVSSGNLIMFFLGWELIGLTSFFLINFWSTRVATLKCALKAYSFNKLSDCFLLLAFILLFAGLNTTDIPTILTTSYLYNSYEVSILVFKCSYIECVGILLLGSAFIKSAQLGAHIWLPDSMEAPVPASALIHSATLVSAGIYILLRFSVFFENSALLLSIIATVGAVTAAYGGIVAAFQTDCKKLLAYSTISHCGFLMVLCTTFCFEYVMLYLYVHGFFKASTFLSVGNILRFGRTQDYRRMGMFSKYLPFDSYAVFVGLLNLAGLPFSFGFYIKHLLFVGLNINLTMFYVCYFLCLIGAVSGLFYSYRLYYYVFFDFKKARRATYMHVTNPGLNSTYYTNAGVAGMLAISSLIVVAYIICFYLLYIYTSTVNVFSDFLSHKNYTTQYEYLVERLQSTRNYQLINLIIVSLILCIVYTP
jgi:NADH-quinone oxidoreductase subunit L